MKETAKSCDNCRFAYWQIERDSVRGNSIRQHCRNPSYNSPEYTQEMMLEDWTKGCCRFWESSGERNLK